MSIVDEVRCYVVGVTPTKLWGSSLSRMHDLEKQLHEFEHKRLEADAELKEVLGKNELTPYKLIN